jgi:hypothetical protein
MLTPDGPPTLNCKTTVAVHGVVEKDDSAIWSLAMKLAILSCVAAMLAATSARAQIDLSTYADAKGDIDVQKLTCAQLASTWQEDADLMAVWYSGWYNGLANYSKIKVDRAKELEHRVIVYCKAHRDVKVIKAMDINIKQMRKEAGITVDDER